MSEIELNPEQVEHFMQEAKVADLAKLSDKSFGIVICRIYADRIMLPGPVEIKRARKVKHGK